MKTAFELVAEFRDAQGKGASRRLRHGNKVPAILYGGHRDPRALSLDHTKLLLLLDNERFYSTIINLKVGELNQAAILKDVQRHPAKNAIVHIDLQRVLDDEKIRITIPLHFKGEAGSPGVKKGGVVSHLRNEVEITCLPQDLPEFIEVDLSGVELNQMLYLADLTVPAGVEIPELTHGRNSPIISIHHARASEEPEAAATTDAAAGAAAAPAAGAKAAAGAKPAAAAAKPAADAKKDAKK
ncbi:MAG: 50S ribosomal protein L25/general stress protein Ctc [Steroidobacteraceae bacterium]